MWDAYFACNRMYPKNQPWNISSTGKSPWNTFIQGFLNHGIRHPRGCGCPCMRLMEAILVCLPALSTEWLDWVAISCELWQIRTSPTVETYTVQCGAVKFHIHRLKMHASPCGESTKTSDASVTNLAAFLRQSQTSCVLVDCVTVYLFIYF